MTCSLGNAAVFITSRSTRLLAALYVLAVVLALPARGGQAPDTFKVEGSTVVVDVIVADKKGRHVPGLTASDFLITEEGAPQKILSFTELSSEILPAAPAAAPAIAPSAAGKAETEPAVTAQRAHLLTVVMDLADARPENLRKSSEAVLKYLETHLRANDFIAIYSIDRVLRLALPFTNDMEKARATLAKVGSGAVTNSLSTNDRRAVQRQINDLYAAIHPGASLGVSAENAVVTGGRGITPGNTSDPLMEREIATLRTYLTTQNTLQAKATFVALRAICLSYRDIPGRKNLVLFSEGFLYADDARPQMDAVADAANRSNVALYVIDPSGLELGRDVLGKGADSEISQMVNLANESAPGVGSQSGGLSKFDKIRNLGDSSRNDQLAYLADVTGGLLVRNRNDLLPAFAKVVQDAQNFYSISYQPANKDFDGRFRKIKVELAHRGYELRYRKGYWAIPRGQAVAMTPAAAQMMAGVRSRDYRSPFVPEIYANLLMAPDGHFAAPVSVSFPGSKVPLEKPGDLLKSNITLLLLAQDPQGRIVGVRQSEYPIQIDPKKKEEFTSKTLTLQSEITVSELGPVAVQAIIGLPGGVLASGTRLVAVSELNAGGPQLSSLLLTDRVEQGSCPDLADPLCLENMRLIQPVKARFAANGRLIVYFTASGLTPDMQSKQPRIAVDLWLKPAGSAGKARAAQSLQAIPGPTSGSVMVLAEFDLKALDHGKYSVQAVVQDLVKKSSAKGETELAVE